VELGATASTSVARRPRREHAMKRFLVIVACLAIVGPAPAQDTATSQPPHGLVILELTWSRKISPPRLPIPAEEHSGGLRADPDRKLRAPSPIPTTSFPYLTKLPYFYVYSLKVKNAGPKKIRGLTWEYVSTDLASGEELARRRVVHYEDLGPGKVKTLRLEYSSPPTNVVTPEGLGTDERSPFKSSAEFKCILYADSTEWEDAAAEGACTELRAVDARVRGPKRKRT